MSCSPSRLGIRHYRARVLTIKPGPVPCRETFPLLMDPVSYSPDTLDIWSNRPEMDYWLGILGEQVDNIVEKAIASEGNSPGSLLCAQHPGPTSLVDLAAWAIQSYVGYFSLWQPLLSPRKSEILRPRLCVQSDLAASATGKR